MALFLFRFGKGGSGVLANCSLFCTRATVSFSAGPACSSFSAEACASLQVFRWSRQHQQVCYFFSSPPLRVLLCSRHSVLLSVFLNILNYLASLAGTLFSFFCTTRLLRLPDTDFFGETTRLMSWLDGERCFCPLHMVSYLSHPFLSFLVLEAYCLI